MPKALLLITTLIVILLIVISLQRHNDGFEDHTSFVEERAKHFANIGLGLKVSNKDGTLGNTANPLVSTVGVPSSYPLPEAPTDLSAAVKRCESVKTTDCSIFDNPAFQKDCGLCLDIGENSEKVPTKGGLVVLQSDKKVAREDHRGSGIPNYSATVGSCPAGKLVTTKAECKKLERQLLCQKNSSYDLDSCSQCYSTTNYSIVDPNENPGVIASSGIIYIYGLGIFTFTGDGGSSKKPIPLSESTPYRLNIRGKESSRIKISVYPPANSDPENPQIPYVYGFISGPTQSGRFDLDLRRIVLSDEVTGRRPRSNGNKSIRGATTTMMAPGFGQERMVLSIIIPFSFVDPTSEEAGMCKDAPFVTTKDSANFLESDPCYKKGSGPGKFSLECLQGAWETNGCSEGGKGYPGSADAASNLMANPDGSLRSLNDISDFIYRMALITKTGFNEKGKQLDIEMQSKASVFCTGREITSPCDTPAKDSGPLSPDCIKYLWNNKGEKPLPNGSKNPVGQTYTGNAYSLFKQGNGQRFCQETGTLSPFSSNTNIKYWQKFGGVTAVQREMNNLHVAANAQLQADDKLAPYLRQCYGEMELAKPPPCSTSLLPPSYVPKQNTVLASNLQMTEDFILTMDITPRGTVGNWASIIHFTTGPDCCALGNRAPGLWFYPNTTKLLINLDDSNNVQTVDPSNTLTIGKTSTLKIECKGPSVTVTLDDVITRHSTASRYQGVIQSVYGSDPWYPAANCSVDNLCLRTTSNAVDTRTTVAFNNVNINGSGLAVNKNIGNFPDISTCAAAAKKMYPSGKYGVTWTPGQCWAIGPTQPFDSRFNPAQGWTSAYFMSRDSTVPGINNVGFVRIQGNGSASYLNMSQLVVYDNKGNNVSKKRPTQSSGSPYGPPGSGTRGASEEMANDGDERPRGHPYEFHGKAQSDFWQVKLDSPTTVSAVIVYNRSDCCSDRMGSGFVINLINPSGTILWTSPRLSSAPIQLIKTV